MGDDAINILIADDNREFCSILSEYFDGSSDFNTVDVCLNGLEVIEALEKQEVDVLILDLIMPYMDGIGVLEKMRDMDGESRPRVIILTAFGQESITQKAVQLGADYYILKPFNLQVLGDRVRQVARARYDSAPRTMPVTKRDLEVEVTHIIHEIGAGSCERIPVPQRCNYAGGRRNKFPGAVTKELYPAIAEKYGTTPSRVERPYVMPSNWPGIGRHRQNKQVFRLYGKRGSGQANQFRIYSYHCRPSTFGDQG